MNKIIYFCMSDLYMIMFELGRKFLIKCEYWEEICKYVGMLYLRIKFLRENMILYVIIIIWLKLFFFLCIVIFI